MSASTNSTAGAGESAGRLARQHRNILWRVQKMAFWVLYDYAGYLILLNLLTLAAVLGPAWLLFKILGGNVLIPAALAVALGVVAVAGQATLIGALLDGEEFSLRRVVSGAASHGPRALGLALLFAATGAVAGTGFWFYTTQVWPSRPVLGPILAGLCLSAGVAVLLSGVYVLPALVNQRGPARKALRTSLALAGKHPVLTPGLLAMMAGQGLLLVTPPGLLLLSSLPLVALACCAYELLARHYGAGRLPGAAERGPVFDEEDIFLNRGFKDFLFPWKG